MTDIPVIFSGPMVQALLDGRKTMTRRLRWTGRKAADGIGMRQSPWVRAKLGDRLWVRESAAFVHDEDTREATKVEGFAADGFKVDPSLVDFNVRFRPSIHMPRWASRITLVVTATKIERLQDISHEDAMSEGVAADGGTGLTGEFMTLWEKLHGPDAWKANPEVVALSFRVVRANIDSPEARA